MRRTIEECRARLALCTLVAEHLARILLRSRSITGVGLYGSVARREPGHWCTDVDLMCFIGEQAEGLEFPHRLGSRTARFLRDLGLADFADEINRVTMGFVAPSDIEDLPMNAKRRLVPASLHVLPRRLDVDTMCAFQAAQRDPQFVVKIGRDFRQFEPTVGGFMITDLPWTNLPWQERLPDWRAEHAAELVRPRTERPPSSALVAGGLRVLGALTYDKATSTTELGPACSLFCPRCRASIESDRHLEICFEID